MSQLQSIQQRVSDLCKGTPSRDHSCEELDKYRDCVRRIVEFFCDWKIGVYIYRVFRYHLEPLKPVGCQLEHSCALTGYQCRNGQCVADYMACDGTPQCSDKSDETQCQIKILRGQYVHRPNLGCITFGGQEFHETIHWFLQRPGETEVVNITHRLEQDQAEGENSSDHLASQLSVREKRRWRDFYSRLDFKLVSAEEAGTYFCQSGKLMSQPVRLAPQCSRGKLSCGGKCRDRSQVCHGWARCSTRPADLDCERQACTKLLQCKRKLNFDVDVVVPKNVPSNIGKLKLGFYRCWRKNNPVCTDEAVREESMETLRVLRYLSQPLVRATLGHSACNYDPTEYDEMLESVSTKCNLEVIDYPRPCRKLKAHHWCVHKTVRKLCGHQAAYHAYQLSHVRLRRVHKQFRCFNVKEFWLRAEKKQPKIGHSFRLKCEVKGEAEFRPNITWLRRPRSVYNVPITPIENDSRRSIEEIRHGKQVDSVLSIHSVTEADLGSFLCELKDSRSKFYNFRLPDTAGSICHDLVKCKDQLYWEPTMGLSFPADRMSFQTCRSVKKIEIIKSEGKTE
ncbi:hypothetical protein ElyMa_003755900 [Elysia marginata]|uniref:Ig-like domain-containing protein n=1 Tax=Elysia marginata TaxID=1093978 RepID=A0AAV4F837_9GAST|nr:hypothetical protein ElyMa_003755900 [Elysia marginata]